MAPISSFRKRASSPTSESTADFCERREVIYQLPHSPKGKIISTGYCHSRVGFGMRMFVKILCPLTSLYDSVRTSKSEYVVITLQRTSMASYRLLRDLTQMNGKAAAYRDLFFHPFVRR